MRIRVNQKQLEGLSPAERNAAEQELEALERILRDNPLYNYVPHSKQKKFHKSGARVKGFIGGNRSGKTTAGVVDSIIQSVDKEALPTHLVKFKKYEPPFYCRIITPDFSSTMEGVIFQKIREWCPRSQLKGGSWDSAFVKDRRILQFANGSWWQFMTFEQDLDKFGGAALHRVHYDEEPPEQVRKENRMRLMDYGGDELFTMTPLQGIGWTYNEIWMRRHEKDIIAVQVSIDDNPAISKVEKKRVLDGLSKEEREAREHGKFVYFEGLVYPEWNDSFIVDPPEKDFVKDKHIVVGIDPGLRYSAAIWGAFDNENDLLLFEEVKLEGATVEVMCDVIREKNEQWGIEPDMYIIDPSARNRSLTTAEAVESVYARNGIYAVHGQSDLEAGCFTVKRRLQNRSILVSRNLHQFIWEIERYRIDTRSKTNEKFAVIQKDNHLLDAWRYLVMSRSFYEKPVKTRAKRRWQYGSAPEWNGGSI